MVENLKTYHQHDGRFYEGFNHEDWHNRYYKEISDEGYWEAVGKAWFYLLRKPNEEGTHWIYRFGQSEQKRASSRVSANRTDGFEFTDYIILRCKQGRSKACEDWFKMNIEGLACDYTDDTTWDKGYNMTIDWWTNLPEIVKIKWGKTHRNFSYFTTPIDVDFVADVDGHPNALLHNCSLFHLQSEHRADPEWIPYERGTKYIEQGGTFDG
jgi:hypothetical protein